MNLPKDVDSTIRARTAAGALYLATRRLLKYGVRVKRRGGEEMLEMPEPTTIAIADPTKRLCVLPGRNLNPWVTLAEFPWMLAGRNDIAWLLPYLPRAKDYSDDGLTWRAGYGPRLRNWVGFDRAIDQLAEAVARLWHEPDTRQAVISLWDPENDNERGSKDYPCTNWLRFQRSHLGNLDLHVVMRSNDLWWGFSGVNVTNFTLLQELVATCLGWPVGYYYHTAGNLHLYERHFEAAAKLIPADPYVGTEYCNPLALGPIDAPTPLSRLREFTDGAMAALRAVERERDNPLRLSGGWPLGGYTYTQNRWLNEWAEFMLSHGMAAMPQAPKVGVADWWWAADRWLARKTLAAKEAANAEA